MKAIPTCFDGIDFRSRLEAKWAAFFQRIGWSYTYEPFDADGYIPDFVIHGESPLLVEIKPAVVRADYRAPIQKIEPALENHWNHDIVILGVDPFPKCLDNSWDDWFPPSGLLGEGMFADEGSEWYQPGWDFATGHWCECRKCGQASMFHSYQSYACRPCGHHSGDHYMGAADLYWLRESWCAATNGTQWNKPNN